MSPVYDVKTEEKKNKSRHHIICEGRGALTISGVEDVVSFDEEEVLLYTTEGMLSIRGEGLHINKLSVESGELLIEGYIDTLEYTEQKPQKRGFFSRIMG